VDDLVEWNNVDPDAKLHPKLVLQIFVKKGFDRAGVALLDPARVRAVTLGSEEFLALEAARRGKTRLQYVARPGDTLAKIARRYGLQPGDLARINKLSYSSALEEGQRIYVYSPTPELPREIAVGRTVPHRRPGGAPVEKNARAGKPAAGKTASAKAPETKAAKAPPAKKIEAKASAPAKPAAKRPAK
jgi:peptidoglycan lytic transglycosylase D